MTIFQIQGEGKEKHIPIVDIQGNQINISVGEVLHPMETNHRINIIQVLFADGTKQEFKLNPSDKPQISFQTDKQIKEVRAFCNKHGRWKTELNL